MKNKDEILKMTKEKFTWIHMITKHMEECNYSIALIIDEIPQFAPGKARRYKNHFAHLLKDFATVMIERLKNGTKRY
jgi:hypothetical protein